MRECLFSQSKNTVRILRIEKVVLVDHAAKCKVKPILIRVEAFSEVHLVLYNEPMIATAFAVALIKLALAAVIAGAARVTVALIDVFGSGFIDIKVRVNMLTARVAVIFARHGGNPRTRISYQSLGKFLRAHVCVNVEILQLS